MNILCCLKIEKNNISASIVENCEVCKGKRFVIGVQVRNLNFYDRSQKTIIKSKKKYTRTRTPSHKQLNYTNIHVNFNETYMAYLHMIFTRICGNLNPCQIIICKFIDFSPVMLWAFLQWCHIIFNSYDPHNLWCSHKFDSLSFAIAKTNWISL